MNVSSPLSDDPHDDDANHVDEPTEQTTADSLETGLDIDGELIEDFKRLSKEDQALVRKWVKLGQSFPYELKVKTLDCLNAHLADRVYFVCDRLTVADVVVFQNLKVIMSDLTPADVERYVYLCRWFGLMEFMCSGEGDS